LKKRIKHALFLLFFAGIARAEAPIVELIDVPTAEAVDHYGAYTSFRFYTGGGVLTKAAFGVFDRLNIGFGLDTERFIGSQNVHLNRPTLNMKFRFYDGQRNIPALAIGYDGQGYFFNKATDKYNQREKGLYAVGSGEIIVPGLSLHAGINVFDFNKDPVYGFAGLDYMFQDVVGLIFESDNLFHKARESRFNFGGRYFVTPSFSIDLAARDLWAASRKAERILRINYSASF
jgi:hypothetical protein